MSNVSLSQSVLRLETGRIDVLLRERVNFTLCKSTLLMDVVPWTYGYGGMPFTLVLGNVDDERVADFVESLGNQLINEATRLRKNKFVE